MKTVQEDNKIMHELFRYKRQCKCGHVMFYHNNIKKDKIICRYCGKYIYRTDLDEFKDKINNAKRR